MAGTRKTRAAARAQQESEPTIHTDADVDVRNGEDDVNDDNTENTAPESSVGEAAAIKAHINTLTTKAGTQRKPRAPLEEIAANWCEQMSGGSVRGASCGIEADVENADDGVVLDEKEDSKKNKKAKKRAKKGKNGPKKEITDEDAEMEDTDLKQPEVLEDDNVVPGSPASDEALEILKETAERSEAKAVQAEQPKRKTSPAVRATRKQLAKTDTEQKPVEAATPVNNVPATGQEVDKLGSETSGEHQVADAMPAQGAPEVVGDSPEPPTGDAAEKRFQELFQPLPVPEVSENVTTAASPPRSPSKTVTPKQDPIEALDATEEAVEAFEKSVSDIRPTESSKKTPVENAKAISASASGKKVTPRPAQARVSKPPVSRTKSAARPSTIRTSQAAVSSSTVAKAKTAKARPSSISAVKPVADGVSTIKQRSAITALHTPPPAAKSTKPVTKAEFQLPGEALAAKLKAQKEERLQRQEEAAAKKAAELANQPKPTTKPATKTSKPAIKPAAKTTVEIKSTAASRKRESIAHGTDADGKSTVSAKRISTAGPALSTAVRGAAPRVSTLAVRPKPFTVRPSLASSTVVKPTSTTIKPSSKPPTKPVGPSLLTRTAPTSTKADPESATTTTTTAAGTAKGKIVFNRDRIAQEEREKALKDKAEAAKKARADAAERGRQASKDWADKMAAKKAAAKAVPLSVEKITESSVETAQSTAVDMNAGDAAAAAEPVDSVV